MKWELRLLCFLVYLVWNKANKDNKFHIEQTLRLRKFWQSIYFAHLRINKGRIDLQSIDTQFGVIHEFSDLNDWNYFLARVHNKCFKQFLEHIFVFPQQLVNFVLVEVFNSELLIIRNLIVGQDVLRHKSYEKVCKCKGIYCLLVGVSLFRWFVYSVRVPCLRQSYYHLQESVSAELLVVRLRGRFFWLFQLRRFCESGGEDPVKGRDVYFAIKDFTFMCKLGHLFNPKRLLRSPGISDQIQENVFEFSVVLL